ncbi:hypothetical protein [Nonomuraea recticatena]|uniref:S-methyl thiohydantoin desulfurase domain-containing protein n=1 Tax=Nonomuraea recticatena TaxID=46178 RepID=UPI0031F929E5
MWIIEGCRCRPAGVRRGARPVRRTAVPGTLTLGMRIGAALRTARERHEDPFDALTAALAGTIYTHGLILFRGKVVDIDRRTVDGFARGHVTPAALDDPGDQLRITFPAIDVLSSAQQQWFPAGPTTVGAGPWSVSAAVVVEVASTAATTRALRARTRCPRRERTANLLLS